MWVFLYFVYKREHNKWNYFLFIDCLTFSWHVIFCNSLFLRKGPNTCPFVSSVNIFFRNYQDCKVEIDMSGFFHACLKTALSGMG